MSLSTEQLHSVLLDSLGESVVWNSDTAEKPLQVDLRLPHPPRLQAYVYNLVEGAAISRPREYKISIRVPGQKVGDYGSFANVPDRFNLLIGYRADLDVFVLWDVSLHPQFKAGGNIQVSSKSVLEAAASGLARHFRQLRSVGKTEIVFICQRSTLLETLRLRIFHTGGE